MRSSTVQIAWRNLGRNKRRTLLAMLAIGVGQFALVVSCAIMRGYTDNIRRAITGPMVGHVQIHAPEWREERALDLCLSGVQEMLDAVRADPAVQNAGLRIYAPVLAAPITDAFPAVVVGVDVAVESEEYGLLSGLSQPLAEKSVLVGYRLAQRMKVEPGQEIALFGQGADGSMANDLYVVQDIVRSPADLVNQSGIVMSLPDAQALFVMPDQAHEMVIRASASTESRALAADLAALPAVQGMEVLPWEQIVPELVKVVETTDVAGYFVLIVVFIAAVAGITNTLMMAIFERMHEFGMLLALGSRPNRLVHMIMVEAILLGVLGVALGTAIGAGTVAVTAHTGIDMASWGGEDTDDFAFQGLKLPLQIRPQMALDDVLMGLMAIIGVSFVASLWPAFIVARLEPMEAMRA